MRERENHERAATKEYTELDGTRRTRRQLPLTEENKNAGRRSHTKGGIDQQAQE